MKEIQSSDKLLSDFRVIPSHDDAPAPVEEKYVLLSVVIPFYNEEGNIEELYYRLSKIILSLDQVKRYEFIFVDDGSIDLTWTKLVELANCDHHVKLIKLKRNYGQTAALNTGLQYARGEVMITMDGDLQNAPEDIPAFLEALDEGYDLVTGWRQDRKDHVLFRRLPSKLANKLVSVLFKISYHDFGSAFRAGKREYFTGLELRGHLHRFIPVLLHYQGARCKEIPITCQNRCRGKSKYGLSRIFTVFLDIILLYFLIKYIHRPLQFFGRIGLLFFSIGFAIAAAASWRYFVTHLIGYGDILLSVLLMIMGIQFILTGLAVEVQAGRSAEKHSTLVDRMYSRKKGQELS